MGLLNEGMRYRDLETGTFLTRDPIGYGDGPNVYCYVHCNPITKFDPHGLYAVIDDAIALGSGAVLGGLTQVVSDCINGEVSSGSDYVGAIVSGAISMEATMYAGPLAGGAIGGAVGELSRQGSENIGKLSKGEEVSKVNWGEVLQSAVVGGVVNKVAPGIKAKGRGSYQSVAKQMATKFKNGTIKNVSKKTAGKMSATHFANNVGGAAVDVVKNSVMGENSLSSEDSVSAIDKVLGNNVTLDGVKAELAESQAKLDQTISDMLNSTDDPIVADVVVIKSASD